MFKSKYGNELAFVMGNIVASYGGQLEKKAQMGLSKPYGEEDTGGPIPASNALKDIDDPTILTNPSLYFDDPTKRNNPDTSSVGAEPVKGEHTVGSPSGVVAPRGEEVFMEEMNKSLDTESESEPEDLNEYLAENYNEDLANTDLDQYLAENFGDPDYNDTEVDVENSLGTAGSGERPNSGSPELSPWNEAPPSEWTNPPNTAALVLDSIQKIAAYLGDKGDIRSELIAGELLHSFINELKK